MTDSPNAFNQIGLSKFNNNEKSMNTNYFSKQASQTSQQSSVNNISLNRAGSAFASSPTANKSDQDYVDQNEFDARNSLAALKNESNSNSSQQQQQNFGVNKPSTNFINVTINPANGSIVSGSTTAIVKPNASVLNGDEFSVKSTKLSKSPVFVYDNFKKAAVAANSPVNNTGSQLDDGGSGLRTPTSNLNLNGNGNNGNNAKGHNSASTVSSSTSSSTNKEPAAHHPNSHHHHNMKHHHNYETLLLKELLQLSIKREKIEKSLAATGYQKSIDAINWLMKHSKDPMLLDDSITSSRDFILVLCPIGRLANQISTFLQQSKIKCGGPNDAHFNNILPYMKLSSFFKIKDSHVCDLHRAFDLLFKSNSSEASSYLTSQFKIQNKKIRLNEINIDLHITSQMILLYPDIDSENLIKEIVESFSRVASKLTDCDIVPYSKQLHLTLAYNFDPDNKRILEELAIQHINYRMHSDWEIRLYSRDSRVEAKQTYKVTASHKAKAENELNLKLNDYIFANSVSGSNLNSGKDQILRGMSNTTGESGYFAGKHVERAAESDTWKLHKSHILVGGSSIQISSPNGALSMTNNKLSAIQQAQQHQLSGSITVQQKTTSAIEKPRDPLVNSELKPGQPNLNPSYSDNLIIQKKFQTMPHRSAQTPGALRFFFVRHGERIDLAFGPQWIDQAFDRNGKYRRINLNMPSDMPVRPSKRDFLGDSPLTEVGKFQARLTGDALGNEGYKIHYCYVSPALRCIQTAHQILQAMGLEKVVKIRIEPSIFEFLGWYDKGLPTFMNLEPLLQFGYNIDVNYRPLLPVERLQPDESYTDYYQRSFNITKYFTNFHQNEGANILVVGHAGTLEVCTRQICGFPVRPYIEFNATIRKVPYLGICLLEKEAQSHMFEIQQAVIPPISHTANFNFDPLNLKL